MNPGGEILLYRVALLVITIAVQSIAGFAAASELREIQKRCLAAPLDTPEIYMNDFKWGYSLETMSDKFTEVYDSGRRLQLHAQYQPQTDQFVVFYREKKSLTPVVITGAFIKNVTRQIEIAIEQGYAEFPFFPDMGHSHLHFPKNHWQKTYGSGAPNDVPRYIQYQKMLADPKMRPLYHLTEQLQMVDKNKQPFDHPVLNHKYWNRNFWGTNDGSHKYETLIADNGNGYNTVGDIEGHHKYSAGFGISASKDGCFPYKDKNGDTKYFDISLYDPGQDPNVTLSNEFY